MLRQSKWIAPMMLTGLVLTGCGGGDTPGQSTGQAGHEHHANATATATPASNTPEVTPAAMKAFADNGQVVQLALAGNDRMQFDQTRLTVAKGAMVRLTLKHTGQLPAQSMGHNVVILAL